MRSSVLVAGIGNIFNRDDGFGVEVATRLSGADLPANVRVKDFGIRGFDLVLALLECPGLAILVDALSRGCSPGTLYRMEPDLDAIGPGEIVENGHGLNPVKVLAMAKSLGAIPGKVVVIGCEPATLGDDTGVIGLSEAIEAAVDPAIRMIRAVIGDFNEHWSQTGIQGGKAYAQ